MRAGRGMMRSVPFVERTVTAPDLTSDSHSTAGGRGWCVARAGAIEAAAPKPGNVHPGASFPDLTYADLVAAANAIAPIVERAAERPVGRTILDAVRASRSVTRTNANLGIVLATVPLAAVPDDEPLTPEAVDGVLARLGADDAADVYAAIAVARPGGMGTVDRCDVAGPPPRDIRAAMRLASDRDQIARLWAFGYDRLFEGPVADLTAALDAGVAPLDAIVLAHLGQLARQPDSLIARRHGAAVAVEVSARAAAILALPVAERGPALAAFDTSLRHPHRLNPGTTADLLAAALYILLRDERTRPAFADVSIPTPSSTTP
jgi:triphosphoribosyl-dephospho-CoA synthase